MGSVNAEVNGRQSRDGLDIKCDRVISELERLTDQRQADGRRIAVVDREQENQQADTTRYPSRWFYVFVLLALLSVALLYVVLVPRKF